MTDRPVVFDTGNLDAAHSNPPHGRRLIVTADDFGLCDEINAGVIAAHDCGIVTSASLMVRWPSATAAARLAATRPLLALGLHVDLGEWTPSGDDWEQRWSVVDSQDPAAVSGEVARQVQTFRQLTGADPTHIDGHQHIQRDGHPSEALRAAAAAMRIPVRLHDPRITYCGEFYGQAHRGASYPEGITVANLVRIITSLPLGWTELGCHPGIAVPRTLTSYAAERDVELDALCSPEVLAAIDQSEVTLASFAHLVGQLR